MPAATHAENAIPKSLVVAAGALMLFTIIIAALGRLSHHSDLPAGSVALSVRDLRFADAADGGVAVTDATTGQLVTVVHGQAGFLRGTLRGLANFRKRDGIGEAPPFRLTAWKDGRLTLDDTATGRHIELEAFGETNEAAFAALLAQPHAPAPQP